MQIVSGVLKLIFFHVQLTHLPNSLEKVMSCYNSTTGKAFIYFLYQYQYCYGMVQYGMVDDSSIKIMTDCSHSFLVLKFSEQ